MRIFIRDMLCAPQFTSFLDMRYRLIPSPLRSPIGPPQARRARLAFNLVRFYTCVTSTTSIKFFFYPYLNKFNLKRHSGGESLLKLLRAFYRAQCVLNFEPTQLNSRPFLTGQLVKKILLVVSIFVSDK